MGGRRGGSQKHHNKNSTVQEEEEQEETLHNESIQEKNLNDDESQYETHDPSSSSSSSDRIITQYLRSTQPILENIIQRISIYNDVTNEPLEETVKSERDLIISQILKEIKGKEISIMRHQRGAKIIEKVFIILQNFGYEALQYTINNKAPINNTNKEDDTDNNSDETYFTPMDSLQTVKSFLRLIGADAVTNATHIYASHSIQFLLELIPVYIKLESKMKDEPDVYQHEKTENNLLLSDLFLYFFNSLRMNSSLSFLILDSCATHVIRCCLLILNGYIPKKSFLKGNSDRDRHSKFASKASFQGGVDFFQKGFNPSEDYFAVFADVCKGLIDDLNRDALKYALDPHGSATIQIIVKILTCLGENTNRFSRELLKDLSSAFIPLTTKDDHCKNILQQLLFTPAGTRLIETLIINASSDIIHSFVWNSLNTAEDIMTLSCSSYGNFVMQKLLQSKYLTEPQLSHILSKFDFSKLVSERYTGVLWKLAEACLRLKFGHKTFVNGYLTTLEANTNPKIAWWCILTNQKLTEKKIEEINLVLSSKKETNTIKKDVDLIENGNEKENQNKEIIKEEGESINTPPKLLSKPIFRQKRILNIDPIGCSILATILQFPSSTIEFLINGFKAFSSKININLLEELAKDRQGSWLLQAILSSSSSLPQKQVYRFIRTLVPLFPDFALHPNASFVITYSHRAASDDLRKEIAEILIPLADTLKNKNYSLFKSLGLGKYLQNNAQWAANNTKHTKIYKMFEDIIENKTSQSHNNNNGHKNYQDEGKKRKVSGNSKASLNHNEDYINKSKKSKQK